MFRALAVARIFGRLSVKEKEEVSEPEWLSVLVHSPNSLAVGMAIDCISRALGPRLQSRAEKAKQHARDLAAPDDLLR